jgi:hypothetical protein
MNEHIKEHGEKAGNIQEFWKRPLDKKFVYAVIALVAALLIFKVGVSVGYHKASFSYRSGDAYYRMFDKGPRMGMMGQTFFRDDFSSAHGAVGKIVSVSLPTFVVASPDNIEKTVIIGDDTIVRMFRGVVDSKKIAVDDFALVLGTPDDTGRIGAKFIRLMPYPRMGTSSFEQ